MTDMYSSVIFRFVVLSVVFLSYLIGGLGEELGSVLMSLDGVCAALCSLCRWSYPQTFEFVNWAVVSSLDIPELCCELT